MNLTPITSRLADRLQGIARQVDEAAGLEAAMGGIVSPPAAFVIPLADKGRVMPVTGITRQHITHLFGVVYCVENFRAATGAAAVVDLEVLRDATWQALVGWVPDAANGEPVLFLGGELVQMEGDGRLWWADEFFFSSYFRSNN